MGVEESEVSEVEGKEVRKVRIYMREGWEVPCTAAGYLRDMATSNPFETRFSAASVISCCRLFAWITISIGCCGCCDVGGCCCCDASAGGSSVGGEITNGCCDVGGFCSCDASVGGSSVGGAIVCGGGCFGGSRGGTRRRDGCLGSIASAGGCVDSITSGGCLGSSDGSIGSAIVDVVIVSIEGGDAVTSSSEKTFMGTRMFVVSTGIFASLTTRTWTVTSSSKLTRLLFRILFSCSPTSASCC